MHIQSSPIGDFRRFALLLRLLLLYGLCIGLAQAALTEQQKFTAPDFAPNDGFGTVIALSGDGNTALIGDPRANCQTGTAQCGAVYVVVKTNGKWQSQQKLSASDAVAGDGFGTAAALSSNGNTAVIGSPFHPCAGGVSGCGSAYVFVRSGGRWSEIQTLTASDASASSRFGAGVAISDNNDTILVGAPAVPCANGAGQGCGAAYAFVRNAAGWNEQQRLQPADTLPGGNLGAAVALSADGRTALAGATGAACSASGSGACGAAYAFASNGATWDLQQTLVSLDLGLDQFGYSVALSANGAMALIGAPSRACNSQGVAGCGAAYVFTRDLGQWTQNSTLLPASQIGSMTFGTVVALAGNGEAALIAAPGSLCGTSDAPVPCLAAHAFARKSGQWTAGDVLIPTEPVGTVAGAQFGRSLALSKDGAFALVRSLDSKKITGSVVGAVSLFSVLPRLTLVQSYAPNPVQTGDTLSYALNITNGSKARAPAVTLVDKLPAKLDFVSAPTGCAASGQTITCKLGALAAGAETRVEIKAIPRIPGKFTNTLTLKSTGFATITQNQTVTVKANASGQADLSIALKADKKTVKAGTKLVYTLTALNAGPSDATDVVVSDVLPAGTRLVSAPNCAQADGRLSCRLGKLGPTQSRARRITVRAPSAAGDLVNSVEVAGSSTDPDPANNSASVTVRVK
ncbi:hypothetical protein [Methylomagnum sp.]